MDQKSIGSFIQSLRKEEGLTQKDLGSKIGVTNSTISRWEKGDSYPDAGMYEPLSQALGVSVAELLSGRRMTDREYRNAADEKIISLARENEQGNPPYYRIVIILSGFISVLLIITELLRQAGIEFFSSSQLKYIAAFFMLSILMQICSGCLFNLSGGIRRFVTGNSDSTMVAEEVRAMKTAALINAVSGCITSITALSETVRYFHDSSRLVVNEMQALSPLLISLLINLILVAMAYCIGSAPKAVIFRRTSVAALLTVLIISYIFVLCQIQIYPDGKLYDDGFFIAQRNRTGNDGVQCYFKDFTNHPVKSNTDNAFSDTRDIFFNGKKQYLNGAFCLKSSSLTDLKNSTGADLELLKGTGFDNRENLALRCGTGKIRSIHVYMSDISASGKQIHCDVLYTVTVISPQQMIETIDTGDSDNVRISSFVTSYNDRCYLVDGRSDGSHDAYINDKGIIYHLNTDMPEKELKKCINGL